MVIKYSRGPYNIPTFYILKPFQIYPYWDFWCENKPSGNPGARGESVVGNAV
jgi:hypothetical protein